MLALRASRTARLRLIIAGLLAVAAVAAGLLLFRRGSGTPSRQLPLPPAGRFVGPSGVQLIGLLDNAKALTYHARYRATGGEAAVGGKLTLEIWRKAPALREDTTLDTSTRTAHTESFQTASGAVQCSQFDRGTWSCRKVASDGADQLFGSLRDQLAGQAVGDRADKIGGRSVRCFVVGAGGSASEICATPDGIPVRVRTADGGYELVELSFAVPKNVFTPPA